MSERKVKGTMLVDQVRMIRRNKDKKWEPFFTPEEWKTINSKIMDSVWYPLGLYIKCGIAVFTLLAGKDPEVVRHRGRARGLELFNGVYRSIIFKDDPFQSLKKFVLVYRMLFNFSTVGAERLGVNHAQVHHDFAALDRDNGIAYCYQLMGSLESLLDLSGARNVRISLVAKQWEGAATTTLDILWA